MRGSCLCGEVSATRSPAFHIFVGSKAPWHEITDDLPQHLEHPQ
jgi:hypothetical protein